MKNVLKLTITTATLITLIGFFTGYFTLSDLTNSNKIDIRDEYLEKELLEDIDDLTKSTIEGTKRLYIVSGDIYSIEGLENFTNLEDLTIDTGNVTDLSPISNLTNLTKLDLSSNNIFDLTPLSKLSKLEYLSLDYNRISDVSPLKSLINLKFLSIKHNNEVNSISSLKYMDKIEKLSFEGCNVKNIEILKNFNRLQEVNISNNDVNNYSPIDYYGHLKSLVIDAKDLDQLKYIQNSSNLKKLVLKRGSGSIECNDFNFNRIFKFKKLDTLLLECFTNENLIEEVKISLPNCYIDYYFSSDYNL